MPYTSAELGAMTGKVLIALVAAIIGYVWFKNRGETKSEPEKTSETLQAQGSDSESGLS